ncbi:hypothetical protein GYMLUDRAFT_880379 [Collybiopsis luxurians FD-317 M1]|uniref:Uncharacterized protein n=1 Tax=Collybiopsis luxurians FD-317 M1 TaxID=944289 RepID=A0A0D0CB71_9AGAR|nr:hypothetical protein GYMLUDRAFT_880379 [Collybiopsis luxurians FD-317 M1]
MYEPAKIPLLISLPEKPSAIASWHATTPPLAPRPVGNVRPCFIQTHHSQKQKRPERRINCRCIRVVGKIDDSGAKIRGGQWQKENGRYDEVQKVVISRDLVKGMDGQNLRRREDGMQLVERAATKESSAFGYHTGSLS